MGGVPSIDEETPPPSGVFFCKRFLIASADCERF
jgi:hypothetical protein